MISFKDGGAYFYVPDELHNQFPKSIEEQHADWIVVCIWTCQCGVETRLRVSRERVHTFPDICCPCCKSRLMLAPFEVRPI